MEDLKGVVPLCHPNNFSWDSDTNQLTIIEGEQRHTLELIPIALDTLANIKDAVAVICICGPARSGKSYVLSQLQDGVAFELGHTMTSKTTGIWMSREPTVLLAKDGARIRLVLLDTEGLGAAAALDDQQNDKWDNQIFTLSTLISSLLIYNSQGVPNTNDLEKLNFIANLSQSVYAHTNTEEEGSSSLANFRNYSPDFFWLVRDLVLQPTDKNGQKCDIKTYLLDNVLRLEDSVDESDVKSKRNRIRQNIREMFPTFDAYGLPMPSLDPDVIQNMNDPSYRGEINRKFTNELQVVKNRLLNIVKPKRITGASFLTGATLVQLIKTYVKALNEKGCVPEWNSAWENAVKVTAENALNMAIEEYRKYMQPIYQQLPCDNNFLLGMHNDATRRASELFAEETKMTTELMSGYTARLMAACAEFDDITHECTGGILMEIISKNFQESEKFCEEICIKLQQEHIDPILENITAETRFEDLLSAIELVNGIYDERAIGPSKGFVQHRFARAFEQRLKEAANDISKMKNYDEKLKVEMEERMRKETEIDLVKQQNDILSNNLKMAEEQHKQQLSMMQQQQERSERELQRLASAQAEDKERLTEMMKDMKESHKTTVEALVRAQEQQVQSLSAQRAAEKKALEDERAKLKKEMEEQAAKIDELTPKEPPKKKKKGCVIL